MPLLTLTSDKSLTIEQAFEGTDLPVFSTAAQESMENYTAVGASYQIGKHKNRKEGELYQPNELNNIYGGLGLSFTEPVSLEYAESLAERKRSQLLRESIYAAGANTLGGAAARLGGSIVGAMLDPTNFLIPPLAGAKALAIGIKTFGNVTLSRFALGAAENVAVSAAFEPLNYAAAKIRQDDYTLKDSATNLLASAILGGGFRAGLGAISDRLSGISGKSLSKLEPNEQVAILQSKLQSFGRKDGVSYEDIRLGDKSERLAYGLMDIKDLVTSASKPEYFKALGKDLPTPEKLDAIIKDFDASKLVSRAVDPTSGAPIVGADGVVESGSLRVEALRKLMADSDKRIGEYKQLLKDNGFEVSDRDNKILVAMRLSEATDQARAAVIKAIDNYKPDISNGQANLFSSFNDAANIGKQFISDIPAEAKTNALIRAHAQLQNDMPIDVSHDISDGLGVRDDVSVGRTNDTIFDYDHKGERVIQFDDKDYIPLTEMEARLVDDANLQLRGIEDNFDADDPLVIQLKKEIQEASEEGGVRVAAMTDIMQAVLACELMGRG